MDPINNLQLGITLSISAVAVLISIKLFFKEMEQSEVFMSGLVLEKAESEECFFQAEENPTLFQMPICVPCRMVRISHGTEERTYRVLSKSLYEKIMEGQKIFFACKCNCGDWEITSLNVSNKPPALEECKAA